MVPQTNYINEQRNIALTTDNDYIEFAKINIYNNDELNFLVYEGLTGGEVPLVEIIMSQPL